MMKDAMAQLLLLTALVHASQAPEECSGPTTEICATVGSNFTLPFRSSGCDPRCTWLRDSHDVCFCRDGYLHCEAGYKSRFKVSCENVTEGDGSMTILSVQEGDGGLYCFPDSRRNSSCFNLVVKRNGTSRQVADLKNSTTLPNNTTDDPNKGWETGVAVGLAIGLVVGFLLGALTSHFWKKKCPNKLVQDVVHHDQRRNDVEMQRNGDDNEDDTQHQLMPQEG